MGADKFKTIDTTNQKSDQSFWKETSPSRRTNHLTSNKTSNQNMSTSGSKTFRTLGFQKSSKISVRDQNSVEHTTKNGSGISAVDRTLPVRDDEASSDVRVDMEEARPDPKRILQRKRRRLMSTTLLKEENLMVYDDDSLQRHIAAESYNEQSQYLDASTSIETDKLSKLKLLSSSVFQEPVDQKNLSNPRKYGKDLDSKISALRPGSLKQNDNDESSITSSNPPALKWLRGNKTVSVGTQAQKLPISQEYGLENNKKFEPEFRTTSNSSCTSQASSSTDSMSQVNSPDNFGATSVATKIDPFTNRHRHGLRNMLVKDDTRMSSPSPMKALAFTSVGHDKGKVRLRQDTAGKYLDLDHARSPEKGQRLVDQLNQLDYSSNKERASDEYSSDSCDDSPSLSILSTSESPKLHAESQEQKTIHPAIVQPMPMIQGGSLKVTYARQRSYLTDSDVSQSTVLNAPSPDHPSRVETRRRGARFVSPQLSTLEALNDISDEFMNSQGGTMRSIHELREAGGNARSISEMDAILDDVVENNVLTTTQRRSRLLDLATRLQDLSFCQLFIEQRGDLRLFARIDLSEDPIANATLVSTTLQLFIPSMSTSRLSQIGSSRIVYFLTELLDKDQDLMLTTRSRTTNMSKVAQGDFVAFWGLLLGSAAWRAGRPPVLTTRAICLQCIEYLIRHARESGCIDAIPSQHIMMGVSMTLKRDLLGPERPKSKSLVDIQLAVSTLESCTLNTIDVSEEKLCIKETLDSVIMLLPLLTTWSEEEVGTLRTLALRLQLNLTNNSLARCKIFSRPDIIRTLLNIIVSHFRWLSEDNTRHDAELLLDNLILALGSMINLSEWCDTARQLVMSLHSQDTSFLDTLILLFTIKQQKAAEVR